MLVRLQRRGKTASIHSHAVVGIHPIASVKGTMNGIQRILHLISSAALAIAFGDCDRLPVENTPLEIA